MSTRTTNFGPRVSFTTTLADPGPVHVLVDSNSTLEAAGTNTFSGAITGGAATWSSVNTFTAGASIGGATLIQRISTITGDVNLGSCLATNSISSTIAFAGVAIGDTVFVNPSSEWSGAYLNIQLVAQVTATNVITLVASNVSTVNIDPADVVMRFTAIEYAEYL